MVIKKEIAIKKFQSQGIQISDLHPNGFKIQVPECSSLSSTSSVPKSTLLTSSSKVITVLNQATSHTDSKRKRTTENRSLGRVKDFGGLKKSAPGNLVVK